MGKARMGVIGAGWWATQFHIPSLKTYENAELVGIADLKEDKLAKAADYYDIANQYTDHRELLASGVDGVVIAVQHAFHYEVARDALDAGVSVMVEKPMTLRADEAWDLVERAKKEWTAPDGGLHLPLHATRRGRARHRAVGQARRDTVRVRHIRLYGRVVPTGEPRRLRRRVQIPRHRPGAVNLLRPLPSRAEVRAWCKLRTRWAWRSG